MTVINNLNLNTKVKPAILHCTHCHGTLAWDKIDLEYTCIQCGRVHDKNGELVRKYLTDGRETIRF